MANAADTKNKSENQAKPAQLKDWEPALLLAEDDYEKEDDYVELVEELVVVESKPGKLFTSRPASTSADQNCLHCVEGFSRRRDGSPKFCTACGGTGKRSNPTRPAVPDSIYRKSRVISNDVVSTPKQEED